MRPSGAECFFFGGGGWREKGGSQLAGDGWGAHLSIHSPPLPHSHPPTHPRALSYTYGGAAFTVSGFLFAVEATGSWWRGVLPSRLHDLASISWHAAFWNFYGGVGFLIGGAAVYAYSFR